MQFYIKTVNIQWDKITSFLQLILENLLTIDFSILNIYRKCLNEYK